ncbi:MAG: Lrp/AsnC family transcriptional regulator [Candidatus Bathyarchaeia archaeon]
METNLNSRHPLDELDLQILGLLQEDSRLSYNKIASKLGISVGTAYNRIKSLEEQGVVKCYTALLDASKIGYELTALILIQAEGKHLVEVENEVAGLSNVMAVYDITGDFDIAVIARFKNREGLNHFIKKLLAIPYIKRTVTNVVLNVVKEDPRIEIPKIS